MIGKMLLYTIKYQILKNRFLKTYYGKFRNKISKIVSHYFVRVFPKMSQFRDIVFQIRYLYSVEEHFLMRI